ncbi:MAG: trypsin-like peptidase domain-containing protein [Patescibacteria group bacterium]
MSSILKIIGVFLLGVLGSLVFQALVFPWMLSDSYFEKFEFIKSFKKGKIVVNPKEQVYIQENTALQASIEKTEKSVVAIQSETGKSVLLGSGFVITSDGLIITVSDLAIAGAKITVFMDQEKFIAEVIKKDLKNNLALLKIEKSGLSTTSFFDSDKIKLGQRVFLIGKNTATKETAVNEGIIKTFNDNIIATNITDSLYFRGGPLFDVEGRLVGINTVDSSGKIFSISVKIIKTFAGF